MTKIRKFTLLFALFIGFFVCLTLGRVIATAQPTLVVDEGFFDKTYARNAELTLPSAQLDGVNADIYTIAPSGSKTQGNKLIVGEYGEYTVVYSANEKTVERSFNVKSAPSSLFTVSDGVTLTNNKQAPSYMLDVMQNMEYQQSTTGLGVRVTDSNATMRYNGIINLNDISGRKIDFLEMLIMR